MTEADLLSIVMGVNQKLWHKSESVEVFVVGEEVTVVKVIVGVMKPKNIDLVEGKLGAHAEADRLREPGVVLVFKAVPYGPNTSTDGP